MCLIIYSPAGSAPIPEAELRAAHKEHPDGIGVMSTDFSEKFLGKKMLKRSMALIRDLEAAGQGVAVHFRWATHGATTVDNCHPFRHEESGALVMHNGVIACTNREADKLGMSDTLLYVRDWFALPPPSDPLHMAALRCAESVIGYGSKLVVAHATGEWSIVNRRAGIEFEGRWYSNSSAWPRKAVESLSTGFWRGYEPHEYMRGWGVETAPRKHLNGSANGNVLETDKPALMLPKADRSSDYSDRMLYDTYERPRLASDWNELSELEAEQAYCDMCPGMAVVRDPSTGEQLCDPCYTIAMRQEA